MRVADGSGTSTDYPCGHGREAIKHVGGICQLLGVILVLQEVLAFARYRGELAKAVAWLHDHTRPARASAGPGAHRVAGSFETGHE